MFTFPLERRKFLQNHVFNNMHFGRFICDLYVFVFSCCHVFRPPLSSFFFEKAAEIMNKKAHLGAHSALWALQIAKGLTPIQKKGPRRGPSRVLEEARRIRACRPPCRWVDFHNGQHHVPTTTETAHLMIRVVVATIFCWLLARLITGSMSSWCYVWGSK